MKNNQVSEKIKRDQARKKKREQNIADERKAEIARQAKLINSLPSWAKRFLYTLCIIFLAGISENHIVLASDQVSHVENKNHIQDYLEKYDKDKEIDK